MRADTHMCVRERVCVCLHYFWSFEKVMTVAKLEPLGAPNCVTVVTFSLEGKKVTTIIQLEPLGAPNCVTVITCFLEFPKNMITRLKNQTAHGRFWNKNRAVVGGRGRGLGPEKLEN